MIATPHKRTNETQNAAPKHTTRQSSANRRREKSRTDNVTTGSINAEQPTTSQEILAEASGTEISPGEGNKAAMVSSGEELICSCDTCQHGELSNSAEGLSVRCRLGVLPGTVIAGGIVAQSMARTCQQFEEREAALIPEAELKSEAEKFNWQVGDRVRIIKAPRYVGSLSTVKNVDDNRIGVLPDGGMFVMDLPSCALEFMSKGETESNNSQIAKTQPALESQTDETPTELESSHMTTQSVAFQVGDRVRVIKGTAKGLISYITRIEPNLKHSCTLHVGGRQHPDCLEKLEETPSTPTHIYPSTLDQLAEQINRLHSEGDEAEATVLAAGKAALQLRKEEGDRLIQAKAQLKHGEWGTWLKENCPQISDRSARLYMQLAEGWEELCKTATVADLTLREAIKRLPKKSRQQPTLVASTAESQSVTTAPLEPGTEVYFNSFSGVITKLEGDRAIVKMDDGKFENLELDRLSAQPPDYSASRITGLRPGDRLTTPNGSRSAEVTAVQGHEVTLLWDNDRSQTLSDSEIEAYGYHRTESLDPAQASTQPEVDKPDPLKWLDVEFEQSIEFVQEFLDLPTVKARQQQVGYAVRDLGSLPVAILAAKECDRDELLQLQDIVKRILEITKV